MDSRIRCRVQSCISITISSLLIMFLLSFCIFLLISQAWNVEFYVTEASLTQFYLSTNNTLSYNLRMNITVRNPNQHITVSCESIEAIARYKERAFDWVSLKPFDQDHKNTTFRQPLVFEGESRDIDLEPGHVAEHEQETRTGIYNDFAVDLDVQFTAKYGRNKALVTTHRLCSVAGEFLCFQMANRQFLSIPPNAKVLFFNTQ